MAIVKFLSSSPTFRGVMYNEERVKNGEAELIHSANFPDNETLVNLGMSHVDYLQMWSSKNTNIKKAQLHVTISVKGKEMDEEQLKEIAIKWLINMGYGDNPYLVYFHKNTDNNHIHIVSSRVDSNGNKINNNYEGVRANKVLNEILGFDEYVKYRKELAALLRFSFSTNYQFTELLRTCGYEVKDSPKGLDLYKSGYSFHITNELIDFCSKRYYQKIDADKKKKYQALIYKYAALLNKENFMNYMKDKFGLQFIFYGKNGTLNGFTVIDLNNKTVFKGSEIFSLKKLASLLEGVSKDFSKFYNQFLSDLFKKNKYMGSYDIMKHMLEYNILYHNGCFYDVKDKNKILGYADEKWVNKILYNDKIKEVNFRFSPTLESEYELLSKLFNLRKSDLKESNIYLSNKDLSYYKSVILSCLTNDVSIKDAMKNIGVDVYKIQNDYVFIDSSNNVIFSYHKIDIDKMSIEDNLNKEFSHIFNLSGHNYNDEFYDENSDIDEDYEKSEPGLFYTPHVGVGGSKSKKRKK